MSNSDRESLVAFLKDLVRIPGNSGDEERVAGRVYEEMRRVGIDDVHVDRMGNVIGRIGSGSGSKLMYNGHMDTVDAGDKSIWTHHPYEAVVEDGYLHGRGAVDMKGPIASLVYGVKMLIDGGVELNGDLYVVGVVQEEPCEGMAMRNIVEKDGLRPDWVLLAEPTGLQVARGHRGRIELLVGVRGRPCHASMPELGENAIYGAARLIFGLELLATNLAQDGFLGKGSLSVTQITSYADSRNVVPDNCQFIIDRRLTLGETEAKAIAEVQGVIAKEGITADVFVTTYDVKTYTGFRCQGKELYPAWVMPEDHPFVQSTISAARRVLGYRPEVRRWDFSTDGVYTMGEAGIPTVGFGPGEEKYAHAVDERVNLEDCFTAASVYARLARDMLK